LLVRFAEHRASHTAPTNQIREPILSIIFVAEL